MQRSTMLAQGQKALALEGDAGANVVSSPAERSARFGISIV